MSKTNLRKKGTVLWKPEVFSRSPNIGFSGRQKKSPAPTGDFLFSSAAGNRIPKGSINLDQLFEVTGISMKEVVSRL